MLDNAIEATGLTKKYDKLLAVDHISFSATKGEIFGFLGPNGAGKTTTIRMLTGISKPTEGTATIMGYDIQRQPIKAKEQMGIVPDVSNIYNELSAWDNLIFTGKLYDAPKEFRQSRAEELLKMFGLYERRKEKVQVFSRGMKRRVCIAMALMNRSSIVFLDEPTSGLDVQSVEVAFEATPVDALKELEHLPNTRKVMKEGDKFRLFTDDPSSVLASVWSYTQKNNLRLVTVNTLGPSLEDEFVNLTGIRPTTEVSTRSAQGK